MILPKKTGRSPGRRTARSSDLAQKLATTQFSTRILHVLFAVLLAHQFLEFTLFATFRLGWLLVEAALLDLLEETFLGDGTLESLQQFFWGFPASQSDANQTGSLSLGPIGHFHSSSPDRFDFGSGSS